MIGPNSLTMANKPEEVDMPFNVQSIIFAFATFVLGPLFVLVTSLATATVLVITFVTSLAKSIAKFCFMEAPSTPTVCKISKAFSPTFSAFALISDLF